MDPNATLKEIGTCLITGECDEVDHLCQSLYDWIKRDGFEPHWTNYPLATSYYKCRKAHHDKGERVS